jgi:hypothetical protein
MKSRWERYCELRNFDNWCLRNPQKANLVGILAGLVIFAFAQILEHLPPELLLFVIGASLLFLLFLGETE